ncbi:centromere protein X-like [Bombyx mandarina]|uniref:Centromere protein X n=2 Tax=Bombyx TaxID=7090 RepID=A0A060N0C9_BOMMO|nr:centromere protein X-like [Bombyx mori]XP_028043244.1 centromere protein X-like [Bombyx mandarina]BAN29074.1 FANCM interacting histone-fold protein 2 [Bombyx mori]
MARNIKDNNNIDPATLLSNVKSTIKKDVIKELLENHFQESKTKIAPHALMLLADVAKCLVTETCLRAVKQAQREGSNKVDVEHIEKCLPQLMLDFP